MRWGLVLVLAGCGRMGFDPLLEPAGDGPGGDGGGSGGGDTMIVVPPGSYRDAVLADAPLAYFRLDDTGTTAADETGRYTGTYGGGCTRSFGGLLATDPSTAVRFDGVDCRIDITGDLGFQGRLPFSVEVWARQESVRTVQSFFMNHIRQGATPREGYAIVDSQMGVFFERYGGNTSRITSQYASAVGAITHYVGTYDGTTLRFYVDGVEYGTPNSDAVQNVDQTGSIPVIGNFPQSSGDLPLHGVLDEVAIYDKALAADRIAIHHAIGRDGPQ